MKNKKKEKQRNTFFLKGDSVVITEEYAALFGYQWRFGKVEQVCLFLDGVEGVRVLNLSADWFQTNALELISRKAKRKNVG